MSPTLWMLAAATFVIILLVAAWSLISVRRRQKYGRNATGLGGEHDPMA